MGKPTICIGENIGADHREADLSDSAFVFATRIVQILLYLTPKFLSSNQLLCLYRLVCVGPVRKPHCWFSHEAAQLFGYMFIISSPIITQFITHFVSLDSVILRLTCITDIHLYLCFFPKFNWKNVT